MYYICCINVYIQQILQLGPVARAREMLLLQRGLLLLGMLGGSKLVDFQKQSTVKFI